MENCTCGLAMRMNSAVAAAVLEELRKHDSTAADRIVATANEKPIPTGAAAQRNG